MDANGANPISINGGTARDTYYTYPAGSPDGKQLAFVLDRGGYQDIYVMNADGSNQINVSANPRSDFEPDWSPDGRHITFQSDGQFYKMKGDGASQVALTSSGRNFNPAWSPDGKHIAFVSDRDSNEEIYIMEVDGSNQTNISRSEFDDRDPAWSPDGRLIVFISNRASRDVRDDPDIYVMNRDGSDQRMIVQDGEQPTWSD